MHGKEYEVDSTVGQVAMMSVLLPYFLRSNLQNHN